MVEAFGNRSGQNSLFELLLGPQASISSSFIARDDIHSINAMPLDLSQLAKWDAGTKQITEFWSTQLEWCFFLFLLFFILYLPLDFVLFVLDMFGFIRYNIPLHELFFY